MCIIRNFSDHYLLFPKILPIIPRIIPMLSLTYYSQNYASIMCQCLLVIVKWCLRAIPTQKTKPGHLLVVKLWFKGQSSPVVQSSSPVH